MKNQVINFNALMSIYNITVEKTKGNSNKEYISSFLDKIHFFLEKFSEKPKKKMSFEKIEIFVKDFNDIIQKFLLYNK